MTITPGSKTTGAAKNDFVAGMAEIAREAGALLMEYFHQHVKVEYKGEVDLVTVADRKSEALILQRIQARWPKHDVVGEEGASIETGSDYRWYVDPLDGTTNFAHGFPVFCVSLALEWKGQRIAGVVYDPTRHKNPNIFFYHQITLRTHGVRRAGSAALDLASVASGRFDGFWEFNLNPWDTAAGVLLVEEAGGVVTDFSGRGFQLDSRETVASNGLVHKALLSEFAAIFEGRELEELPNPVEYAKTRGK